MFAFCCPAPQLCMALSFHFLMALVLCGSTHKESAVSIYEFKCQSHQQALLYFSVPDPGVVFKQLGLASGTKREGQSRMSNSLWVKCRKSLGSPDWISRQLRSPLGFLFCQWLLHSFLYSGSLRRRARSTSPSSLLRCWLPPHTYPSLRAGGAAWHQERLNPLQSQQLEACDLPHSRHVLKL